jgi:hypothetical protein
MARIIARRAFQSISPAGKMFRGISLGEERKSKREI